MSRDQRMQIYANVIVHRLLVGHVMTHGGWGQRWLASKEEEHGVSKHKWPSFPFTKDDLEIVIYHHFQPSLSRAKHPVGIHSLRPYMCLAIQPHPAFHGAQEGFHNTFDDCHSFETSKGTDPSFLFFVEMVVSIVKCFQYPF